MSNPRYLFVLPSLRTGGAEKVVIRIANDLAFHGEQVALVVLDGVGELRADVDPGVILHDLQVAKTRYAFLALARLIRKQAPELVFSSLTRVSLLLLLARPLLPRDTRIVVRQPSIASIDLQSIEPRWMYQLLFARLMSTADAIVTQSGVMTSDLARILPAGTARIIQIPNPAPIVDRQAYLEAGTPFNAKTNFLAVGRLSPEKGYDTLLAAFAIVAARHNDVQLTVIGSGPLEGELRDLAAELQLSDRVSFLGFVANPFLYYVHANAVVLASRWEGFPSVIVEAIASGTPVVATACGGVTAEIVEDGRNGFVVVLEGAEPLARGMLDILALTQSGRTKNIASTVSRFAPKLVFAEYRRVLSGLTGRQGRTSP